MINNWGILNQVHNFDMGRFDYFVETKKNKTIDIEI